MHFCEQCGNMYYIKVQSETEDNLIYYCRKCGHEDNKILENTKSLCVSKTHISNTGSLYSQVINKYTKLDPTLPRIKNMKCPNANCSTNSSGSSKGEQKGEHTENEIIYIRYDDTNLKYVYLCTACDHIWKT
jgi:DNA-directed RNA polymerase subunit M/transcription elongation factor TFIIS